MKRPDIIKHSSNREIKKKLHIKRNRPCFGATWRKTYIWLDKRPKIFGMLHRWLVDSLFTLIVSHLKLTIFHFLNRICTKDYKIPGSNVTIEKGTAILIPCFSLQRDDTFYPGPLHFDPTRFYSENKKGKTLIDMPFLPFGDGPRSCIGQRLGKMSVKMGLATILIQNWVEIDEQHIGKEMEFGLISSSNGLISSYTESRWTTKCMNNIFDRKCLRVRLSGGKFTLFSAVIFI